MKTKERIFKIECDIIEFTVLVLISVQSFVLF